MAWGTYSETNTGFVRARDRGTGVERLVAAGQRPAAVAVEGDIVYWVNATGSVWRADLSSPTIVPVLLAETDASVQAFVLYGDDLYVTTWGPVVNTPSGIVGSVFRIPKVPTPTAEGGELLFRGPILATGLAVDERAIYFGGWWTNGLLRIAR